MQPKAKSVLRLFVSTFNVQKERKHCKSEIFGPFLNLHEGRLEDVGAVLVRLAGCKCQTGGRSSTA